MAKKPSHPKIIASSSDYHSDCNKDSDSSTEHPEISVTKRIIHTTQIPSSRICQQTGNAAIPLREVQRQEGKEDSTKNTCTVRSSSLQDILVDVTTSSGSGSHTNMQIPPCLAEEWPQVDDVLRHATLSPPCTIETLRELDLRAIQNNLNLRIDICYDHDLFFQPISGKKGDAKKIEAEKYWLSLAAEFRIYWHSTQPDCALCHNLQALPVRRASFVPRLPAMFANLREIVRMLVPEAEHESVTARLDVELLMQQVRVGILDIVKLSEWLTALITSHCAPMRDRLAQDITKTIRTGAASADMRMLVGGIEKLFGLLETMKLDIANHQIRAFRCPLIEDAVPFQQDCFNRTIKAGQMKLRKAKGWYEQARNWHQADCVQADDSFDQDFEVLVHAAVNLCNPIVQKVPSTFQYDHGRFVRLQEDLQDLIQMSLCLAVFEDRAVEITGVKTDLSMSHESLKSRIIYLTENEEGTGGAISDHLDSIGVEITRAIAAGRARPNPLLDDSAYRRTIKLLHDAFHQEELGQNLTKNFLLILEHRTNRYAREFLQMSTLEISVAQRQWSHARLASSAKKESLLADFDDMARRLAHIAVIHWRVWADLCYLKDLEQDDMGETKDIQSPLSVSDVESMFDDYSNSSPSFPASPISGVPTPASRMTPDSSSDVSILRPSSTQQDENQTIFSDLYIDGDVSGVTNHLFDSKHSLDTDPDTATDSDMEIDGTNPASPQGGQVKGKHKWM